MSITTVLALLGIVLFLVASTGHVLLSRKPMPTTGRTLPHRRQQRTTATPLVQQRPAEPAVAAPRTIRRLPMKTYRLRQRRKVRRLTAAIVAQRARIKELEQRLLEQLVLAEV